MPQLLTRPCEDLAMGKTETLKLLVTRLASQPTAVAGTRLSLHDVERLRVPDSPAARAAEELAVSACTRSLVHHGIRSYAWGALLGLAEERRFDAEVLYVAGLLHDIGLMEEYDRGGCFEADGEAAARELLLSVGWAPDRANQAAHAIRDHWDGPESEEEVESLLLAYGTSVDVSGWRLDAFDESTVDVVVGTAPREGFKTHFIELVERQAKAKPHCRVRQAVDNGFADRVLATPFDS